MKAAVQCASGAVSSTRVAGGTVARIALSRPPRNILDRAALRELDAELRRLSAGDEENRRLRAILLCAEGPSFSLGASVPEHARREAPAMLEAFSAAVRALLAPDLPIVAAVRGHCLGGGLELVLLAAHVVVHADARLGQPEIRLGALAPVASVVLPRRIGQAHAESLLLSGRVVDAAEALRLGLADDVTVGDPEAAAMTWIESCLLPHSASSLRIACRAARMGMMAEVDGLLAAVERLYRNELCATDDAEEGVRAFVEKRPPRWSDR